MKNKKLLEYLAKFPAGMREMAVRQLRHMKNREFLEAFGLGAWTNIVADAAHQKAIEAYNAVPSIWRKLTYVDTGVADFKDHHMLGAGAFSDLELVQELESYPMDAFSDKDITLSVDKYGKMFGVSMEATVNDATRLLSRWATEKGKAAARTLEKRTLQTFVQANPTVQEDGNSLYDDTNHANDVGTSGGYSRAQLVTAIAKMVKQTGLDGEAVAVMPKFLVVRPEKYLEAMEDVTSAEKLTLDSAASANVLVGRSNGLRSLNLEVLTSPYLTTDAFYLFADPAAQVGLVRAFLNNRQEPELLTENQDSGWSFEHDATRHKCRLIFGDAWVDHRATVRGGVTP